MVAALSLVGLLLYRGWCVLPLFGTLAWLLAPVAAILFASALILGQGWSRRFARRIGEEAGHG